MNKETHLIKLHLKIDKFGITLSETAHRIKREHEKVYKLANYNCNGLAKSEVNIYNVVPSDFKAWVMWVKRSEIEYGKAVMKSLAQSFLKEFVSKPITEFKHQGFN